MQAGRGVPTAPQSSLMFVSMFLMEFFLPHETRETHELKTLLEVVKGRGSRRKRLLP